MKTITGVVITYNEESNIRDCILSLKKICNEIVVVDSESSDRTRVIAEALGARIIIQIELSQIVILYILFWSARRSFSWYFILW
jgi:glycosyltransferase involved in cell wall biosynthesis